MGTSFPRLPAAFYALRHKRKIGNMPLIGNDLDDVPSGGLAQA